MNSKNNSPQYKGKSLTTIMLNNVIFEEIISSFLIEVDYTYLSSNKNLNKEQVRYLFTLKIDSVIINLLRHRNCPKEEIEKFLVLNDKIYNIAIAHNSNLTQSHINSLLKTNDKDVKVSLEYSGLL